MTDIPFSTVRAPSELGAKIIIDSAAQSDPGSTDEFWGVASFHTVGRPSLADIKYVLSEYYYHPNCDVDYSETTGTGTIKDEYMLLFSGLEIEIPAPELDKANL